jgi:putative serine protease PepD
VITDVGGRNVSDASELTAATGERAAGTTVTVTFQRGGQQHTVQIVLGAVNHP